jgi:hypothetical protein
MRYMIIVTLLIIVLTNSVSADPVRWEFSEGGNGNWYLAVAVETHLNWNEANALAISTEFLGAPGHLVTVTSQAENDWVLGLINPERPWWTGGIQAEGSDEPRGGWGWVTGEAWAYENWCPFEPNNTNGDEDRIGYADYTTCGVAWNDASQFNTCTGYIIEWEAIAVSNSFESWGKLKSKLKKEE